MRKRRNSCDPHAFCQCKWSAQHRPLYNAYDLYLIFNEALKLPLFCEIINAQSYTADYTDANGAAKQQVWKVGNWNLKETASTGGSDCLSGKTGTTQAAGYCLNMASDGDDGKEYISVVLKICKSSVTL